MGRPHTTIGAEHFHFRVRNGIGWFLLAIAARQTGLGKGVGSNFVALSFFPSRKGVEIGFDPFPRNKKQFELLSDNALSHLLHVAKAFWRYMAKPHEQLVLVSFIHY